VKRSKSNKLLVG